MEIWGVRGDPGLRDDKAQVLVEEMDYRSGEEKLLLGVG
jgi:hypothetical protein